MINLKCDSPVRIRNKYTGDWMFVNCRKCPSCQINAVNTRCVHLLNEVKRYPYIMMVTLTYDNEHLPYMTVGSYDVYRGLPDRIFPKVVNRFEDLDLYSFETIHPSGFPEGEITAVINYKDIQDFFKRLRINYERATKTKFGWQYHCLGEYGTVGKRPHFHVLFFGNKAFDECFRSAIIKSWTLHDWCRLDLAQIFKYAEDGVSSYLTSYLNSLSGNNGFLQQKRIKAKCFRSKRLDFGIDEKLFKDFQEGLRQGFRGRDFKTYESYLRRIDTSRLGGFSSLLLPRKVISSCFAAPARVCCTSFNDFLLECTNSYRRYNTERGKEYELENSDYRVILAYDHYRELRRLESNFSTWLDFVNDSWLYGNYYKSLVLQESMEVAASSPSGYKSQLYNTKVDDLDKRDYWLLMNNITYVDNVNTPRSFGDLQTYKTNYMYKLLPKHLHGYLNGNNL